MGSETVDKWIGIVDPRRDTGGGAAWMFCWVLQLLYTLKNPFTLTQIFSFCNLDILFVYVCSI